MSPGPRSTRKAPARGILRGRRGNRPAQRGPGLELVWDGKPDSAAVDSSCRVGFGCVEHLVPPGTTDQPTSWRHRLFHADNKDVLAFLADEFAGAIDLIYIDPPFDIGLDFALRLPVGETGHVDMPAYSDRWTPGAGSHAHMMWERLHLMRGLLRPSGCIFLHCDWRSSAVMRLLLDEVFGPDCFRNEIIWRRAPNLGRQAASNQLGRVAESILVYSARPGTPFLGTPPTKSHPVPVDAKGRPRGTQWDEERQRYFTTAPRGDYTDQSIARLRAQGRIHDAPSGKVYVKYFLRRGDDDRWYKDQPVDTIWDDPEVRPLRHCGRAELAVGYATQKPEGLLQRIISWASPPGGLVADFFCGSGTTGIVAQRLGRRWIMADASPVAIRIARGRLIGASRPADAPPAMAAFDVFHPLESRARRWFTTTCGGDVAIHRRRVLEAFGAREASPVDPFLHGVMGGEAVHVLPPGERLEVDRVAAVAKAASQAGMRRLCCLAERFDPALHRPGAMADVTGDLQVRLVPIPDRPVEPGESGHESWPGFPDLALGVKADGHGRLRVELRRFGWKGPGASETDESLSLVEWWGVAPATNRSGPFSAQWQDQRTWRRRSVERVASVQAVDDASVAAGIRVAVMDTAGRLWLVDCPIESEGAVRSDEGISGRLG